MFYYIIIAIVGIMMLFYGYNLMFSKDNSIGIFYSFFGTFVNAFGIIGILGSL